MKNLFSRSKGFIEPTPETKMTIILKCNTVLSKDKKKELEIEYSEKLNANVVIIDARFSEDVRVIYEYK